MALKNKKKPTINIYTDGACKGNPGPGGWGAILIYNKHEKKINGFSPQTTNNIMELTAVIEALKILKEKCNVKITTDSKYVKLGITEWIYNWKKNGWRNAQKKPLKNKSLWEMLDQLQNEHNVEWYWVKAHAGHLHNEQADLLANQAIQDNVS
tara:strand:+ start:468 stop:926 length:459 start_codon:yes stop_codon:yes gene_type:complete